MRPGKPGIAWIVMETLEMSSVDLDILVGGGGLSWHFFLCSKIYFFQF